MNSAPGRKPPSPLLAYSAAGTISARRATAISWPVFGLSPLADAVMVYLLVALALCATILVITILEKFVEGGWLTLLVSAVLLAACFAIKRHYGSVVVRALRQLDSDLPSPPEAAAALSASRKASSVSRPSPPIGGVPSP